MSLLLDALRQAEKNKSQPTDSIAQEVSLSVDPLHGQDELLAADPLSLTRSDTQADTIDDWVKIDLIPFADLTFPATDNLLSEESGDISILPDSDPAAFSTFNDSDSLVSEHLANAPIEHDTALSKEVVNAFGTELSTPVQELETKARLSESAEQVTDRAMVSEQDTKRKTAEPEQASRKLAKSVLLAAEKPGISSKQIIGTGVLAGTLAAVGYLYWLSLPPTHSSAAIAQVEMPDNTALSSSDSGIQPVNSADPVAVTVTVDESKGPSEPASREVHPSTVALTTAATAVDRSQQAPPVISAAKTSPTKADNPPTQTEDFVIESPNPIEIKVHRQVPQAETYLKQAYQLYQQHDYIGADRYYRLVLTASPNNIDALLGMGAVAEQLGNQASAEAYNQKVLALDNANIYAGNALIRLKQIQFPAEKESNYQGLLQKFPDAAQTHAALGDLYLQQERWSEAQQAYFNAISKAPDNAEYHYNLAVSLDHLGKEAIARRYYQQALQLAKIRPASFDTASVYLRLQQLSEQ